MPQEMGLGVLKIEPECVIYANRIQRPPQKHPNRQRNIKNVGALCECDNIQQPEEGGTGDPQENGKDRRASQGNQQYI
jgi:hypothetical protein